MSYNALYSLEINYESPDQVPPNIAFFPIAVERTICEIGREGSYYCNKDSQNGTDEIYYRISFEWNDDHYVGSEEHLIQDVMGELMPLYKFTGYRIEYLG